MSEEEIDKMKQKVKCNEDSDCNECPYKMGDECLLYLYQKEKEKNKELEEQLRKANEYIRNEMYIDDNPTICGDEEDTITELPISLYLYDEGLRELLELLKERN